MRATPLLPMILGTAILLAACSSDGTGPTPTLTIRGAGGPPPPGLRAARLTTGDPASALLGMYTLYVSPNTDCSAAIQVQDYGATPLVQDMLAGPTLFSATTVPGTYRCVAFRMSDVIHVSPATTFGNCIAGTDYALDIYRLGETDWKDIDLNPIIGSGDRTMPVDDHVTIVITEDTLAAVARGFAPTQVLLLTSDLVVPGSSTLYWDATGTMVDTGTRCDANPGVVSFR